MVSVGQALSHLVLLSIACVHLVSVGLARPHEVSFCFTRSHTVPLGPASTDYEILLKTAKISKVEDTEATTIDLE